MRVSQSPILRWSLFLSLYMVGLSFISYIHGKLISTDLTLDARVKFCSDSIEDILGYLPSEVKGKSCWEYFHPDEIPFAKSIHAKGIDLDKAAVLNYCRVKHKDGTWIGCECVFTVVHDVLVASTSVYRRGPKSQRMSS